MPRRPWLQLVLVVAAMAVWPGLAAAQKTDIVTMPNGDKITGEVKSLSRGKHDYNTDDLGRLSIEWIKLTRLISEHYFDVEVMSGRRYFGRLAEPAAVGVIVVKGISATPCRSGPSSASAPSIRGSCSG